jgi:hypothetical protein
LPHRKAFACRRAYLSTSSVPNISEPLSGGAAYQRFSDRFGGKFSCTEVRKLLDGFSSSVYKRNLKQASES